MDKYRTKAADSGLYSRIVDFSTEVGLTSKWGRILPEVQLQQAGLITILLLGVTILGMVCDHTFG